MVVRGAARFTMFPSPEPDQKSPTVGPLDLTPAGQPITLVDIRNPDLARFPRYAEAAAAAEVAEARPRRRGLHPPHCGGNKVEALERFQCARQLLVARRVPDYFDSPSERSAVLPVSDDERSSRPRSGAA